MGALPHFRLTPQERYEQLRKSHEDKPDPLAANPRCIKVITTVDRNKDDHGMALLEDVGTMVEAEEPPPYAEQGKPRGRKPGSGSKKGSAKKPNQKKTKKTKSPKNCDGQEPEESEEAKDLEAASSHKVQARKSRKPRAKPGAKKRQAKKDAGSEGADLEALDVAEDTEGVSEPTSTVNPSHKKPGKRRGCKAGPRRQQRAKKNTHNAVPDAPEDVEDGLSHVMEAMSLRSACAEGNPELENPPPAPKRSRKRKASAPAAAAEEDRPVVTGRKSQRSTETPVPDAAHSVPSESVHGEVGSLPDDLIKAPGHLTANGVYSCAYTKAKKDGCTVDQCREAPSLASCILI